jgi:hypothetical protein
MEQNNELEIINKISNLNREISLIITKFPNGTMKKVFEKEVLAFQKRLDNILIRKSMNLINLSLEEIDIIKNLREGRIKIRYEW